jgi:hypothetical protein
VTGEDGVWEEDAEGFLAEAAAMPENESSEALEIGDAVVTEESCLIAFVSLDSYSDMCRLDHVDVVTAIANRTTEHIRVFLHRLFDDQGLFEWRTPVHNDRLAYLKDLHDPLSHGGISKNLGNAGAIDQEGV